MDTLDPGRAVTVCIRSDQLEIIDRSTFKTRLNQLISQSPSDPTMISNTEICKRLIRYAEVTQTGREPVLPRSPI